MEVFINKLMDRFSAWRCTENQGSSTQPRTKDKLKY